MSSEVIVYAVCGGLAGVVAHLVSRRRGRPRSRVAFIVTFLLVVGSLQALSTAYVAPWMQARAIREEMLAVPAMRELAAKDPERFRKIELIFDEGFKAGKSIAEITVEGQAYLMSEVMPVYFRRASDDAILGYGRMYLGQLEAHRTVDPQACYALLAGTPLPDERAKVARADAVAELIRSSGDAPVAFDPTAAVLIFQHKVMSALEALHGHDLALLEATEPSAPDRAKICNINMDIYREALALPAPDNAQVMRVMLTVE